MAKKLDVDVFKCIAENTPLISIDLIIKNHEGHVLLGHRNNRPAQGFWFVPGGRILKNESFFESFKRITLDELGIELSIDNAEFLGVYEHFYNDNFSNAEFSTHYIVHGYKIILQSENVNFPKIQHTEYRWFTPGKLLASSLVHQYTKNYFLPR